MNANDQTIRVGVLSPNGVCPYCGSNRWDYIKQGEGEAQCLVCCQAFDLNFDSGRPRGVALPYRPGKR